MLSPIPNHKKDTLDEAACALLFKVLLVSHESPKTLQDIEYKFRNAFGLTDVYASTGSDCFLGCLPVSQPTAFVFGEMVCEVDAKGSELGLSWSQRFDKAWSYFLPFTTKDKALKLSSAENFSTTHGPSLFFELTIPFFTDETEVE